MSKAPDKEDLLEDQRRRWRRGEHVAVESYLQQHPKLAAEPEAVVDLIYNEVFLREQQGDKPKLDEYLRRFSHLGDLLRAQFDVHEEMQREGDLWTTTAGDFDLEADPWPTIPGYQLEDEIGRGGMGVVYRASQTTARQRWQSRPCVPSMWASGRW